MTPAIDRSKGSPPRMRGKDGVNDSAQAVTGITPACAGKSFRAKLPILSIRDHPRVCGEKEARAWPKEQVWGSPPRMRGKGTNAHRPGRTAGITPAYAGKRLITTMMRNQLRDHPRVCGEKAHCQGMLFRLSGLPPRMRGKVFGAVPFGSGSGITPAYAGKRWRSATTTLRGWDHPRVCGEKTKKIP